MGIAKKKIIMFQLPYLQFMKQENNWGNTPWGAAMLKAMAHQEGLTDSFDIEILPADIVDSIGDARLIDYLEALKPDILGATLYLWNSQRSLYIAEQLKARLPNLLCIVGGPEVSESSTYILENTAVDFACIGEGEEVFVAILRAIAEGSVPVSLPGLIWKQHGRAMPSYGRGCISDLDRIPSPLQMGIITPRNESIVSYETTRGCPCTCSYCVAGGIPWRTFSADRIVTDLALLHEYRVKHIQLSCSNFLLHPDFFDICERMARINADKSTALSCFGYAENVTQAKAEALKSCNTILVQTGLQTVNSKTLRMIRRPPFNETRFLEGLGHLRNAGIDFTIDLIAGLPGETPQDIDNSIAFLKRNQIKPYSVFPLLLLPGAPLRKDAAEYGIEADPLPPYTVIKTPDLSQSQILSYAQKINPNPVDFCFDLAQEFRLPRFAATNLSGSAANSITPKNILLNKILIPQATNLQRFAEIEADKFGRCVTMIFSNLEESLTSFSGIVEAVLHNNPFSLIMPVFKINSSAELDEVKRLCRRFSAQNLVRKTVVKDAGLPVAADLLAGFTLYDEFHIGATYDMEKVAASDTRNILLDLSPEFDAVDLCTVLTRLAGTGKQIQFSNLAFYYLNYLISQQMPGSIHPPVDMGSIATVDADGGVTPRLSLNNRMALEIVHMQSLFMRFIHGTGNKNRNHASP